MNCMFKISVLSAFACLGLLAHAENELDTKIQASVSQNSLVGGIVTKPSTGRLVAIVNQDVVDKSVIDKVMTSFSAQLRTPFIVIPTKPIEFADFSATAKFHKANLAIFIVQDASLPMSLVAMESRWMMINAAKVLDANVSSDVNCKRLRREMARCLKAFFSSVAQGKDSYVVSSGIDLDLISVDPIDGQALFNIIHGLPNFGLKPERKTTYKKACQEGWAPAPTNDYQKAIWEQIKAEKEQGPTNALHIKP